MTLQAMFRVFVYGTLKRGQPNHYLIEDENNGKATFIGEGKTVEKYPLVIASRCNIPFLLPVEGQGEIIHGDVFEVDEHMLERLDELECHPIWYKRGEIKVRFNNEVSSLWCYFLEHYRPSLLSLPCMESFDYHSLPDHKKYILPTVRHKEEKEEIWKEVKLPEFCISHDEYERRKFKDK